MEIEIGRRKIGAGSPVYFISEIGSNHDGELSRAKDLISHSAEAGADAVKFQCFSARGLYVPRLNDGGDWKPHPAWDVIQRAELPPDWIPALAAHAKDCSVDFMATPFEAGALKALDAAGAPAHKIASGDLTHHSLLRAAAASGKPLLMSTGMATPEEIESALAVVRSVAGSSAGLFHCVSLYPPRWDEFNLRVIPDLIERFKCPVGLSDHSPGHTAVLGAVALGATMVEKHFTDDRARPGPDHPYAMLPAEFKEMVRASRDLEAALGSTGKGPVKRETPERRHARRGLYAARTISKGKVIDAADLAVLRPAIGLPASAISEAVGAVAAEDIEKDSPITKSLLTGGRSGA